MRKETEIVERLYLALDFWKEKSVETFVTCEDARWFLTSRIHKSFSYFSISPIIFRFSFLLSRLCLFAFILSTEDARWCVRSCYLVCGVKHPLAFVTSITRYSLNFVTGRATRICMGARLPFPLVGMSAERLDSIHHFVISNHLFNVSFMMGLVKCTEHIYWYYTMLVPSAAMNKSSSSEAYGRLQHFFSVVIFVSFSSDSDSFWWNKELDTSLNSWRR